MIKRKYIVFITLISIGILLILMPQGYFRQTKTYRNDVLNFSVNYPADYDFQEHELGEGSFNIVFFISPELMARKKNPYRIFHVTPVDIWVKNINQETISLDEYYRQSKKRLEESVQGFKVIAERKEILNGLGVYKLISTGSGVKGFLNQTLTVYLIHKNKIYRISYLASPDNFNRYLSEGLLIINSFKIFKK